MTHITPTLCPHCGESLNAAFAMAHRPIAVAICFWCTSYLEMTPAGVVKLTDQTWLELPFSLRDEMAAARRLTEVIAQREHYSDGGRH
jgi:hypothetical protein